jgi:hypothetical protein
VFLLYLNPLFIYFTTETQCCGSQPRHVQQPVSLQSWAQTSLLNLNPVEPQESSGGMGGLRRCTLPVSPHLGLPPPTTPPSASLLCPRHTNFLLLLPAQVLHLPWVQNHLHNKGCKFLGP